MSIDPHNLLRILSRHRLATDTEARMQAAVAMLLEQGGVDYRREVQLSKTDRIDFMIEGGVGVELKIDGGTVEVARQLLRYAEHESVTALVLVTTRTKHTALPSTIGGKPLHVYVQGGLA